MEAFRKPWLDFSDSFAKNVPYEANRSHRPRDMVIDPRKNVPCKAKPQAMGKIGFHRPNHESFKYFWKSRMPAGQPQVSAIAFKRQCVGKLLFLFFIRECKAVSCSRREARASTRTRFPSGKSAGLSPKKLHYLNGNNLNKPIWALES